jgi:hypothetical protein
MGPPQQESIMKKLMLILAVAGLSAAATAQTTQTLGEVHILGTPARIELPAQPYDVWFGEFDTVKGTYYLSDGKAMHLSTWGNRLFAKIDGMNKVQLVPAARYVYVADNLQLKVMIDDPAASDGAINATVMLAAPRLSSAAGADEFVTLLAHR